MSNPLPEPLETRKRIEGWGTNFRDLGSWYRRLPWRRKLLAVVVVVVVLFVGYWVLVNPMKREIDRLGNEIESRDKTIADLRHDNEKLYDKNLHLEQLIDPIRHQALAAYPNLEIVAAVVKLSEDLKRTKALGTMHIYRPLSPALKATVETALKDVRESASDSSFVIDLRYATHNANRRRFADDLADMLRNTGFKVHTTTTNVMVAALRPFHIFHRANRKEDAVSLAKAIAPMFNSRIVLEEGSIEPPIGVKIYIIGIPQFLPDGSVLIE